MTGPRHPWAPVRPRRPRPDPAVIVALAVAALALYVAIAAQITAQRPPLVLTTGPCTILGPATHPDLIGPHLVVDCDGRQFGVAAVLP